jgi:hypothetical protein
LAPILPIEPDEPHVQLGRSLTRATREMANWLTPKH